MTKPVDEGRAKRFVLYYFLPTGEGQVGRGDGGLFTGSQREVIEYLLSVVLVEGHVTELIADYEIVV